LFTTLPENVSIGNPVFSKNDPDIIAFDYFSSIGMSEEYVIYGANLETGDLSVITNNNTLGYPSFSKNDDNIAFTRIEDIDDIENVYTIGLRDDKISPSGSASLVVEYSRWPVYYANGVRELTLPPVANFTADYVTGDATLVVKFFDLSGNNPNDWNWTFQGGTPATSSQQNPEVSYNVPGTYRVRLEVSNNAGDNTLNRDGYITVTGVTAVENPGTSPVIVYPNPVGDILYITGSENFSIRIFNQAGQLLITEKNIPHIDVSSLSPGLYIMEIDSESAKTRHKFIKQ
jgi:PKD repeat protein